MKALMYQHLLKTKEEDAAITRKAAEGALQWTKTLEEQRLADAWLVEPEPVMGSVNHGLSV